MPRFTEVKYLSRKNLGNYEHEECQITAVIGENDDADAVIAFTKLKVLQALDKKFVAETKAPEAKVKEKREEAKVEEPVKKAAKKTTKSKPAKEEVNEAEDVEDVTYSLENVKQALASVWKSKGKQVAVEILKEFGVEKSDELAPAKFAEVIAECEKCLA